MQTEQLYRVSYEVRNVGAQGIFWTKTEDVRAESKIEAMERFRALYVDELEFRFPISVKVVK